MLAPKVQMDDYSLRQQDEDKPMSMSKMSRLEVSTLKGGAYLTIQSGRTNARTQMSVDPRA